MTVQRGRIDFDFTGSGKQLETARNIPYRALLATVYTVAKSLLDPEVPANAGYYRTLNISAPLGCVVGPVPPAAIGCRSISASVLGDVIANALSQAMPDKALAGSGPHHLYVLAGSDPRTGAYFVNYETLAGGMGARANRDGVDGVRVHASGSSNLPVEALEHAYPFRVERYALWEGSAGTGRISRRHGSGARLPGIERRYRRQLIVRASERCSVRHAKRRRWCMRRVHSQPRYAARAATAGRVRRTGVAERQHFAHLYAGREPVMAMRRSAMQPRRNAMHVRSGSHAIENRGGW